MSTTNPEHGGTDPVSALAPTAPGSPAADNHGGGGAPAEAVIKRGYEEDGYDAKSVLSVPVLVIGFFVAAFTSVTIMFAYFRHTPVDPMANPQTVEDNSRSLDQRIGATPDRGRPEPLKRLNPNGGSPYAITRPALQEGNPPEYHPEDIRPSPTNTPTLFEAQWVEPGKFARVPLPDAKALAMKSGMLKAREGGARPRPSWEVPTGSNAGHAELPAHAPKDGKKDGKKEDKH